MKDTSVFVPGRVLRRKQNPAAVQEYSVVVSKSEFNYLTQESTILVIPIQYFKRNPSLTEILVALKDYPGFLAADALVLADKLKRTRKVGWEPVGLLTIPDTNACLAALRSLFTAIPAQPK